MATLAGNLLQAKRCWFYRSGFDCYKRAGGLAPCYAILGDHRFYHAAIGGHRCQATTPSDLATALIALDAEILLQKAGGQRRLPLAELYTGPGETIIEADEILTSVSLPPAAMGRCGTFEKLKLWQGDFAVVSVALSARISADDLLHDIRLVCGGIAPTPWRARATEAKLEGSRPTPAALRQALDAELDQSGHPLARNAWKLDALAGLAERGCRRLLESARA
jgi:CO/xanthine dehydrogenase FAD-binding subunit